MQNLVIIFGLSIITHIFLFIWMGLTLNSYEKKEQIIKAKVGIVFNDNIKILTENNNIKLDKNIKTLQNREIKKNPDIMDLKSLSIKSNDEIQTHQLKKPILKEKDNIETYFINPNINTPKINPKQIKKIIPDSLEILSSSSILMNEKIKSKKFKFDDKINYKKPSVPKLGEKLQSGSFDFKLSKPSIIESKLKNGLDVSVNKNPKLKFDSKLSKIIPDQKQPLLNKNNLSKSKDILLKPKFNNYYFEKDHLSNNNKNKNKVPFSKISKSNLKEKIADESHSKMNTPIKYDDHSKVKELFKSISKPKILPTEIIRPKPFKNQKKNMEDNFLKIKENDKITPELVNDNKNEILTKVNKLRSAININRQIKEAQKNYNLHIKTVVQPKLGRFNSSLFIRFRLIIKKNGDLSSWKIEEKSDSKAFNKAAELSIRNARFDPLPKALALNPPYIVVVRIEPN